MESPPKPRRFSRFWVTFLLAVALIGLTGYLVAWAMEAYANRRDMSLGSDDDPGEYAGVLTFSGSSDQLSQTVFVPTLDTQLAAGKNAVWVATLPLCMKRLESAVGGPFSLAGDAELSRCLRLARSEATDLESADYFADGGKGTADFNNRVLNELRAKFPDVEHEPLRPNPEGLTALSFLRVNLKYTSPFRAIKDTVIFHDGGGRETKIKAFGVNPGDPEGPFRDQVAGLYRGPKEYAVDLSTDTHPYQVVLARLERQATLAKTLEAFEAKCEAGRKVGFPKGLGSGGTLTVPNQYWKARHRFAEFDGKKLVEFPPWFFDRVDQQMEFKMDRAGVRVVARTESYAIIDGDEPPVAGNDYPFNRSHLIILRKRNCPRPFFVMWVENAELLERE